MVETGPGGSAPTGVESAPAAAAIASVTPVTRIANPSAIRLRLAASPGPAAEVMCRLLSVLDGIKAEPLASSSIGRFPLLETPLDECRPLGGVVAVQHSHVTGVGAKVDPGGARVEGIGAVRARREVAAGAVDALELDLTGPLELGSVRMTGTFALPEVEDAGRTDPFLRRLAPVARGQRAVGLP